MLCGHVSQEPHLQADLALCLPVAVAVVAVVAVYGHVSQEPRLQADVALCLLVDMLLW